MNKEQIRDAIESMYPDAVINNDLFLEERVLKDFSLEDIAYRLSSLIYGDNLYKYLYSENFLGNNFDDVIFPVRRDMIKYIVVNNIDYFSLDNKELFYRKNIIGEYERLYGSLNFSLDDLDKCNLENLENNSNKFFHEFDLSYYNLFIMVQRLYKLGEINRSDIVDFVDFTVDFLKKKFIFEVDNYDVKYDRYIYELVSYIIFGNISLVDFCFCMNNDNSVKNLLYKAKFGFYGDNLDRVSVSVIGALSGKRIKKIYNVIENKFDVDEFYEKEDVMFILINMCVLLGDTVVDNIVRHLPDDVNSVVRLFDCFSEINLNGVKVINNEIVYNNEFINFFVGDSLKEPTSLLNLIYEDNSSLSSNIEELYYYWDNFIEGFKNQKLLTKTAFLEQSFSESRVFVNPDEYLLRGDVINNYYDNRKYLKLTSFDIVSELRDVYKDMKHNYQKSIPYVKGAYDGYEYETLKVNNPDLFKLGGLCDCCFRIGADADLFLKYCANDKNARVLCIKKDNEIVAFVPMVRNGNLLLCNSIESNNKKDFNFMMLMFDILKLVGDQMIDISSKVEDDNNRIGAVLISNYINDIRKFKKFRPVLSSEISDECICLLDKGIYSNIDAKYCGNYYISLDDGFDFKNFRSFNPDVLYDDPRNIVMELESEYITDNVKELINCIYYEKEKKVLEFDDVEKVIFNDDWFIFIDNKHNITSSIVGNDARAKVEYLEYLEMEYEYCSYYDIDGNIKSNAKYR